MEKTHQLSTFRLNGLYWQRHYALNRHLTWAEVELYTQGLNGWRPPSCLEFNELLKLGVCYDFFFQAYYVGEPKNTVTLNINGYVSPNLPNNVTSINQMSYVWLNDRVGENEHTVVCLRPNSIFGRGRLYDTYGCNLLLVKPIE